MSQSRTHSVSNVLTVTTYDELQEHALAFASGRYSLLVLLGPPGLGKSQTLKACLGNRDHVCLDNHASAFGLYQLLHQHRNEMVVIDDLDAIYADRGMVRLIKALCNTDPVKTLRWQSRHADIGWGPSKIPPEFETKSAVCLIANEWKTLNANIQAIEDRGIMVNFCPPVGEVHVRVREWFDDQVVYEFMERHLGLITRPSMRYYIHGHTFREAHPHRWQSILLELMGVNEKVRTIVSLLNDDQYQTEEKRAEVFVSKGLGDRSTYYRWKQKLQSVTT
tara:strand:- start:1065 stop:1898 length:834 start_codon:yes stop_codon:yes gene_type:complete